MLPKTGRKLPAWSGVLAGHEVYAQTIARLLRKEHGDSHRAVKQLMRQTDASERTVKHWLSAQHGPDTVFFLRLAVTSPVIRSFILGLIESPASNFSSAPADRISKFAAKEAYAIGETAFNASIGPLGGNVSINDPDRDPINDPKIAGLNERQRWFLQRVTESGRYRAAELKAVWKVSLKTARRDIRALQQAGLLEYVGSRRKGKYRRLTQ